MNRILLLLTMLLSVSPSIAQDTKEMKWHDPTTEKYPVVHQQLWSGKEISSPYDRLPDVAEQVVRPEVWNLSRNAAGLKLVFRTDAEKITVRYAVSKKSYAMNHFPATGVSGLDLFAENADGSWAWANGRYSFKDTITYTYEDVGQDREQYEDGRTFHLYLPLYNSIQWLEIGVPGSNTFEFVPVSAEKPIVVYGTSIAQGGCASRPGMAWTNILNRKLNVPVVNLGFSNNGRLEKEVVDLIAEKDAAVFILDCLPNMMLRPQHIKSGTIHAVRAIRARHPKTPVVLTDHSHYLKGIINRWRLGRVLNINRLGYEAYEELRAEGVEDLYYLKNEDIGLDMNDSVDGLHPTDAGMLKYAEAYRKLLASILAEKLINNPT